MKLRNVALLALFALTLAVPCHSQQREIYPAPEHAAADLAAAQHKRVILDFGGDWCTDCQVLDLYFHDATNKPIPMRTMFSCTSTSATWTKTWISPLDTGYR